MIESTRGIILNHIKYGESSIISHVYTEKRGFQSYLINSVRSKNSKGKSIFLQPLTLIEAEVYFTEKKDIHRIKDFRIIHPFEMIPFEPVRMGLAFFIAELLSKVLKHEDKLHKELFNFLYQVIILMDTPLNGIYNIQLFLILHLTRFLGIYPNFDRTDKYFDLLNGTFTHTQPSHNQYMNAWETKILIELNEIKPDNLDTLLLTGAQRTEILKKFLEYYKLHLTEFSRIKSLDILQDIFQ